MGNETAKVVVIEKERGRKPAEHPVVEFDRSCPDVDKNGDIEVWSEIHAGLSVGVADTLWVKVEATHGKRVRCSAAVEETVVASLDAELLARTDKALHNAANMYKDRYTKLVSTVKQGR